MSTRDRSLDCMKGIACVLMILAHGVVAGEGRMLFGLKFLGQFAPLLFFAVNGITASMQSARKNRMSLVIFYGLFYVYGFAYNGIHVSDYWHVLQSDILQCIALSTILCILLLRWAKPLQMLWLTPVPFFIHLYMQKAFMLRDFPLRQMIIPPGIFPVFPWLTFFMFGIGLYSCAYKWKGVILAGLTVLFGVISRFEFAGEFTNKWNMSISFFVFGLALVVAGFVILGLFYSKWRIPFLEFMGKNSLLFLFVHYIPVKILDYYGIMLPWLVWPIIMVATPLMMLLFKKINTISFDRLSHNMVFWIVLLAMVIFNPYLFRYKMTVYTLSFVIGIVFSLNYHKLSALLGEWVSKRMERKKEDVVCAG